MARVDITGQIFGKLTAIKNTRVKSKRGCYIWEFECDCGNTEEREPFIVKQSLKQGYTPCCASCSKDTVRIASKTHGETDTWLYKRWVKIKRRCNNPEDASYKDYGGVGIMISDEFLDFSVFKNYMESLDNYSPEFTIDRVDPLKGYESGNLRWATIEQQARNKCYKNKSGLPNGVNLRFINGNGHYRATWRGLDGKNKEKSFSIRLLGDELALFLAQETRELVIERLNLLGAGYSESHGKPKGDTNE